MHYYSVFKDPALSGANLNSIAAPIACQSRLGKTFKNFPHTFRGTESSSSRERVQGSQNRFRKTTAKLRIRSAASVYTEERRRAVQAPRAKKSGLRPSPQRSAVVRRSQRLFFHNRDIAVIQKPRVVNDERQRRHRGHPLRRHRREGPFVPRGGLFLRRVLNHRDPARS